MLRTIQLSTNWKTNKKNLTIQIPAEFIFLVFHYVDGSDVYLQPSTCLQHTWEVLWTSPFLLILMPKFAPTYFVTKLDEA